MSSSTPSVGRYQRGPCQGRMGLIHGCDKHHAAASSDGNPPNWYPVSFKMRSRVFKLLSRLSLVLDAAGSGGGESVRRTHHSKPLPPRTPFLVAGLTRLCRPPHCAVCRYELICSPRPAPSLGSGHQPCKFSHFKDADLIVFSQ